MIGCFYEDHPEQCFIPLAFYVSVNQEPETKKFLGIAFIIGFLWWSVGVVYDKQAADEDCSEDSE